MERAPKETESKAKLDFITYFVLLIYIIFPYIRLCGNMEKYIIKQVQI